MEVFTGIVACCSITYRPLVEKVIGLSVTESEAPESQQSQGYSKISVQRDVTVQNSHASSRKPDDLADAEDWELRSRGLDERWR